MLEDVNRFFYTLNGSSSTIKYWQCANRSCRARIRTRVSTNCLVSDIPTHNHDNKLLDRTIRDAEQEIIRMTAAVKGSTSEQAVCRIKDYFRANPTLVFGMRSKKAVNMAFWREKRRISSLTLHKDVRHLKNLPLSFELIFILPFVTLDT